MEETDRITQPSQEPRQHYSERYQQPAMRELGTVEDLTWTGSETDTFYVSS